MSFHPIVARFLSLRLLESASDFLLGIILYPDLQASTVSFSWPRKSYELCFGYVSGLVQYFDTVLFLFWVGASVACQINRFGTGVGPSFHETRSGRGKA